ncbi:MAG: protein-disulfide reductase DsbD family protein [Bdellovibrionales bacterium]
MCFIFAFSQAGKINSNPLKAKGYIEQSPLPAGANTTLVFDLSLDEPHRAYSDQFKVQSKKPDLIRLGEISFTNEIEFDDVHSKKKKRGIEKYGELRVPIEVSINYPRGETELPIQLTYQACTDEYCLLPKTIDVPVKVKVVNTYGENNVPSL